MTIDIKRRAAFDRFIEECTYVSGDRLDSVTAVALWKEWKRWKESNDKNHMAPTTARELREVLPSRYTDVTLQGREPGSKSACYVFRGIRLLDSEELKALHYGDEGDDHLFHLNAGGDPVDCPCFACVEERHEAGDFNDDEHDDNHQDAVEAFMDRLGR